MSAPKGKPLARFDQAYNRHEKKILVAIVFVFVCLTIFLAVYFRSFTYTLPAADDWAQNAVQQGVRNQIAAQVSQQYPTLPASSRDTLINQETAKFVQEHRQEYDSQVAAIAQQFRAQMEDSSGHTYLPDLDPYHYLKRVELYLKNGYPGQELRNGKALNTQQLAPIGVESEMDAYTWSLVQAYRISSVFVTTKPMYTLFWFNLFFIGLTVSVLWLIGRHKGLLAGLIAATIVAVHPGSVSRTAAGVGDTETFVLFFTILAVWLVIEAFETKRGNVKKLFILLGLSGLAFGLLSLVWEWWFFFIIVFTALILNAAYHILKKIIRRKTLKEIVTSKETQWELMLPPGFFVSTGIFVSLFNGFSAFFNAFAAAFARTATIKAATSAGIWPNVLTTVAELNEPSISAIVTTMGGKLLFVLAALGLVFALLPRGKLRVKDWTLLVLAAITGAFLVSPQGTSLAIVEFLAVFAIPVTVAGIVLLFDDRESDMKYALILVGWLLASIFAMTKGVRFISLIIPPFAVAVAIALNAIYLAVRDPIKKHLPNARRLVLPLVFLALCLPVVSLIQDGYNTGRQSIPSIDDGWWTALTQIKDVSAPNAIITSWWDFGHWFRYVADRGVTFDGASQRGQLAHLVGRALETDDEREALGILRMVTCGSDTSFDVVQNALPSKDQYEAITLLKRIIVMKHDDARQALLDSGISSSDTEAILKLVHCDPPEDYFITSEDMVGKAGVWGHFGGWDFRKADAVMNFRNGSRAEAVKAMSAKYNISTTEAADWYTVIQTYSDAQLNTWISPWPSYVTQQTFGCSATNNGTKLECPINMGLQSQGGSSTVLESLTVNVNNPSQSALQIGAYSYGSRTGGVVVRPLSYVVYDNGRVTEYPGASDSPLPFTVVIDVQQKQMLITDPLLSKALFTKLFYFNGQGTTAFTKIGEQRTIGGARIVTWKVNWTAMKDLGLED